MQIIKLVIRHFLQAPSTLSHFGRPNILNILYLSYSFRIKDQVPYLYEIRQFSFQDQTESKKYRTVGNDITLSELNLFHYRKQALKHFYTKQGAGLRCIGNDVTSGGTSSISSLTARHNYVGTTGSKDFQVTTAAMVGVPKSNISPSFLQEHAFYPIRSQTGHIRQ
jgi:hypothetical protein